MKAMSHVELLPVGVRRCRVPGRCVGGEEGGAVKCPGCLEWKLRKARYGNIYHCPVDKRVWRVKDGKWIPSRLKRPSEQSEREAMTG